MSTAWTIIDCWRPDSFCDMRRRAASQTTLCNTATGCDRRRSGDFGLSNPSDHKGALSSDADGRPVAWALSVSPCPPRPFRKFSRQTDTRYHRSASTKVTSLRIAAAMIYWPIQIALPPAIKREKGRYCGPFPNSYLPTIRRVYAGALHQDRQVRPTSKDLLRAREPGIP